MKSRRKLTSAIPGMRRILTFAALGTIALAAASASAAPPFAAHSKSGKSLVIPKKQAELGTVYYSLTGKAAQIHFTSDAPLEDIKGQSNKVIGYVVAGPADNPANLQAGEWHLPVKSLKTGIPLRDEHLAGSAWLDAEKNPNIVFQLKNVRDIKLLKQGNGFSTYSVTLVGDMTVHGVTREMSIPKSTVSFLKANKATAKVARGDLLAIRADYQISLKDFKVSHMAVEKGKVANTISISTSLYLATIPPEKQ